MRFIVDATKCLIIFLAIIRHDVANCGKIRKNSAKQAVEYMIKYGYMEDLGPKTSALYSKKGFEQAVKKMQEFGGLAQTGILDDATLALTRKRRCGCKDVTKPINIKGRSKRFYIGSSGWNKDDLTYRFDGNLPRNIPEMKIYQLFKEAFNVWERISPLRFHMTGNGKADVDIQFAYYQHGDGNPFDGPGGILAHAFLPNAGDRGGDIHFDVQENWIDLSDKLKGVGGTDLFTVAAHEIGHALGLSHSNDTDALMFPYYKGSTDPTKITGEDDRRGIEELYVNRRRELQGRSRSRTRQDDRPRPAPRPTRRPRPTQRPNRRSTTRRTRPTKRPERGPPRESPSIEPDICDGSYDAIALIRGELMIFKGNYFWRLEDKGRVSRGYPVEIRRFFYKFPEAIDKVDAIYERPSDGSIVFFIGSEYWIFNGVDFLEDSPQPLTSLGLPNHIPKINAALFRKKEQKTYLFAGDRYFIYDEKKRKLASQFPVAVDSSNGVPLDIDNALEWKDGKSYLFKGKDFWILKDDGIDVERHEANTAPRTWGGCLN